MISLIVYGRNDSYGYNLHKRAALSLNCMATVLTDREDEIVFVDYNTPNDYPTFPEAIQDTLTEKARAMLRILRVRPHVHARFKGRCQPHHNALEPIARNVGVRRSSPANRWILSTNTDMIFVPRGAASLSELASDLPTGLYHLPRFEIPESLWEGFDRHDPAGTIAAISHWAFAAHLHEVVYGVKEIKFDGPGDFQLVERQELFAVQGFHEEMLLGWHIDSNLAKRFFLRYGKVDDLADHLFGYHCDHTRQVTPAHRHNSIQNDCNRFFYEVSEPEVPEQCESWGCSEDEIEEINLQQSSSHIYARALTTVIDEPMVAPIISRYSAESYGNTDYDPRHVLPFLLDIFVNAPRNWNFAWFGGFRETFRLFAEAFHAVEFTGWLLVDSTFASSVGAEYTAGTKVMNRSSVIIASDAFVFDFRRPENALREGAATDLIIRGVQNSLAAVVVAEHGRMSVAKPLRRVVTLNAINNEFEQLILESISAASSPFSTRIKHGYVLPPEQLPGHLLLPTRAS